LYRYVGNSSMNYTDPWGLAKEIMRDIFANAIDDFGQYSDRWIRNKITPWTNLNLGKYDLVYDYSSPN